MSQNQTAPTESSPTHLRYEWQVKIIGGTISTKTRQLILLASLIGLSGAVAVIASIVVAKFNDNIDVWTLTGIIIFMVGVLFSCIYIFCFFPTDGRLVFTVDNVQVYRKKICLVQWNYAAIESIEHDFKPSGPDFIGALVPSDWDWIKICGTKQSAKLELPMQQAKQCAEILQTLSNNAITSGNKVATVVPTDSDNPNQVWRQILKLEFREILGVLATGMVGTTILAIFVWSFCIGNRPQQLNATFLLMVLIAIAGPFALIGSIIALFNLRKRRRMFLDLEHTGDTAGINQLIEQLYNKD